MANIDELPKELELSLGRINKAIVFDTANDYLVEIHLGKWSNGKAVDGSKIKYLKTRKTPSDGVYSKRYAQYKGSRGGNTSVVDLYLNGTLYSALDAGGNEEGVSIEIEDKDGKIAGLLGYYGEDNLIGIAEEDAPRLYEVINDAMVDQLNEQIRKE